MKNLITFGLLLILALFAYQRDRQLQQLRANVKELEQVIVIDPKSGLLYDGRVLKKNVDDANAKYNYHLPK